MSNMDLIFGDLCKQIVDEVKAQVNDVEIVYTTVEVAEKLHTSEKIVNKLRSVGLIESTKIGKNNLFTRKSIEEFIHEYQGYDLSNDILIERAYLDRNMRKNNKGIRKT